MIRGSGFRAARVDLLEATVRCGACRKPELGQKNIWIIFCGGVIERVHDHNHAIATGRWQLVHRAQRFRDSGLSPEGEPRHGFAFEQDQVIRMARSPTTIKYIVRAPFTIRVVFAFRFLTACIKSNAERISSAAVWGPGTMFVAKFKTAIAVSPAHISHRKSKSIMRSSDSTVSRYTDSWVEERAALNARHLCIHKTPTKAIMN